MAELCNLIVTDIDLTAGTIEVGATTRTKARKLPLVTSQVMQLHGYITGDRPALLKTEKEALILTGRGTPMNADGVNSLIETLRSVAPGKSLTATVIRQSVIVLKLKQGMGLRQVQVFAGHKWVSTTEAYRENNLEELRAAVARYHPLGTTNQND